MEKRFKEREAKLLKEEHELEIQLSKINDMLKLCLEAVIHNFTTCTLKLQQ